MIRVTVEIVPYGEESRKRVIRTADISNVGGTDMVGRYDYHVDDNDIAYKGEVKEHQREQSVWKLIYLVLRNIYGDDQKRGTRK